MNFLKSAILAVVCATFFAGLGHKYWVFKTWEALAHQHNQCGDTRSEIKDLESLIPTDPLPGVRRDAIRREYYHAWKGYEEYAWGFDELCPVTQKGVNTYGMALTMIDGLDTLWIMNYTEEFNRAKEYLEKNLSFGEQRDVNLFETTIRVLGGLLSSYALSNERFFKEKAIELGNKLLLAFDTPTGYPYGTIDFPSNKAYNPSWSKGASTMSEIGSIQLEFSYLSRITGNRIYEDKVDVIIKKLHGLRLPLYPQFISVKTGAVTSSVITFGARVDSLYEYLLKYHLITGYKKPLSFQMYLESMEAMEEQLLIYSNNNSLLYISELHEKVIHGKMDHLVCFVPGMLALGSSTYWPQLKLSKETQKNHLKLAEGLMKTCMEFYFQSPTGLSPEIVQFQNRPPSNPPNRKDFDIDNHAAHCLLRPETVESLFLLYRVTSNNQYREWGWEIFKSLVQYARVPCGGYSGLKDVRRIDIQQPLWTNWNDKMESFFLAETLKYLFLLFSDESVIPLGKYVFNTEAHPLPVAPSDNSAASVCSPSSSCSSDFPCHSAHFPDSFVTYEHSLLIA